MLDFPDSAYKADLFVRRAEEADAGAIAHILLQAFGEYRSFYTLEAFATATPNPRDVIERMLEGPVWISLEHGIPVGTVAVIMTNNRCYIRGMAILPEARGKGVGQLLLGAVEDFALSIGAGLLTLSTTPFLERAIKLYSRYGFERTDEGPHDLFGTPLFTMRKYLH